MFPIIPVLKGAILAGAILSAHPAHVPPPAPPAAVAVTTVPRAQQAPAQQAYLQNRRRLQISRSAHQAPAPAVTYTVEPNDTLSGIAAAHHLAWPRLWAGNRAEIPDPDVIVPGQVLRLTHLPAYAAPPAPASSSPPAPGYPNPSQSVPVASGSVTPGSSFEQCVISRESSGNAQVMNSSSHYGLYQFSESTWAAYGGSPGDFGHASPAEQQRVFRTAMSQPGGASNWSPYDGCAP